MSLNKEAEKQKFLEELTELSLKYYIGIHNNQLYEMDTYGVDGDIDCSRKYIINEVGEIEHC